MTSTPMAPTRADAAAAPTDQAALSLALPTPTSNTASSFSRMDSNSPPQHLVGHLELRISANSVGSYPPPPRSGIDSDLVATQVMSAQSPQNTTGDFICLLSGSLNDFLKFSRQEHSKWLIDIAHDICDPVCLRGSLLVWNVAVQRWCPVAPTDPLTASKYRYDVPVGVIVGLSRMSTRARKSVTTTTGNPSTMADRVKRRDGKCWVSRGTRPLINSHICPKRMGDHLARIIFRDFSSPPIPTDLTIYDERFGISLLSHFDQFFDIYELGLRFVSVNQYECHFFTEIPGKVVTLAGEFDEDEVLTLPLLHGRIANPPHPELANNPPPGLIRWHYLQCVLKKFAHADYKALPNIKYYEMPLRMKGDSDDEGTDSEAEWPSAALDRGRAVQACIKDNEQRHRFIAAWIKTTEEGKSEKLE